MRPAYRTGSSSEALSAARRTQLNRGLGLVLGVFGVYALASCFVPDLLAVRIGDRLQVGELVALAQVLAVAVGVIRHDRHARRHVEPLAQRVATREPARYGDQSAATAAAATPAANGADAASTGSFNAFDSSRAFAHRSARSATVPRGAAATRTATAPRTARATS
nr:DUF485 domain-containing protein [Streptomyces sp. HNM0575]